MGCVRGRQTGSSSRALLLFLLTLNYFIGNPKKTLAHQYLSFSGVFWRGEDTWWSTPWEAEGRRSSILPVFVRASFIAGPCPGSLR